MGMLSADLFREVRPGLFRMLGGKHAFAYVDILDALERENSQREEGMSRDEALCIISEVIVHHPNFAIEDAEQHDADEKFASLTEKERARRVLDYLARKDVGWIDEIQLPDWQRRIRFDAHGATLLDAIRKIANPDAAVFTDPFIGVCATLANVDAFAKEPFTHLENCLKGAADGLRELRSMEKQLQRFIRLQLEARTLGESLSVVFDKYVEQVSHTCYTALVRAQLPLRLESARERIVDIRCDADLLHRMQADLMARQKVEPDTAMTRVRHHLQELEDKLEFVQPLADEIDHRTAEFAKRSLTRSRYLREIVGERRGQIKELFERINRELSGCRIIDLNGLVAFPSLLLPDVRLLAGRDSLYEKSHRHSLEENAPIDDEITDAMKDQTRSQLESAMRNTLSIARANRFVANLPGGKGVRIASTELPVRIEEDMEDIIAVLLHAQSSEAEYSIEVPRTNEDSAGWARDVKLSYVIDQFFIIKK